MRTVYIHIPFCNTICTYCDFPKVFKNIEWIDKYLNKLKEEIKENYQGEKIDTLYIGGGTPSALTIKQLKKLFEIIKIFNINDNAEITLEANSEDLTEDKLIFLSDKINRLSIGVQTFDKKILKLMNRTVNISNIKKAFKYFNNINIDLMYGFNEENINILETDLKKILELKPSHISCYCLILEPNTILYIKGYKQNNDDILYEKLINKYLKDYNHYEISNYALKGYESKHNLTYWNNEEYYGFGMGASGYIKNKRYDNTHSINKYLKGDYKYITHYLDEKETMQNEFILGFRKLKGINKEKFKEKYQKDIHDIDIINTLLKQNLLKENKNNIYINPKYIYVSNEILIKFLS